MTLLEELNHRRKNHSNESKKTKPIKIQVEAIYLKSGNRYKRTVMVESDEELEAVTNDFRKRFKDLIEIRSNGALIKMSDEGVPYIDWEENSTSPESTNTE